MNELCRLFSDVANGTEITFENNKTYHVCEDDSFIFKGYFCTNTAKKHENPDGTRKSAIYLKDKKNITIDGNGAQITVHGKMTPLLFDGCENVTVKNLCIDYACPTMTEFTVVSNNAGECVWKFNADCLFRVENGKLYFHGEIGKDGTPYWEDEPHVRGRYVKLYNPETQTCRDFSREDLEVDSAERIDAHSVRVTLKNKDADLPAGSVIQNRNITRDQTGSLFQRCKNLRFENLRVKFMHGLGMVSQFCENVTFFNCDFTPKKGRTVASTADFFQFSGCKGNIVIDSCKAHGAHDDYVNVHGTHLRIVERDKNKFTLRFMHNESWGFQAFEKGDEVDFIKWDTLIPYGSATVSDWEKLNDTDILLTLDGDLPEVETGKDVLENATWTPNLYVRNCDFGPTCGRGILCTTRGEVIIENNRFRNLWGPALLIEDDCNFWFESGCTKEIVFRNNVVSGCEYASMWQKSPVIRCTPKVMKEDSAEFVHGKLTVTGNVFLLPKEKVHCFWLEYIREAEVTENVFDAPLVIETKCVGNVRNENNIFNRG